MTVKMTWGSWTAKVDENLPLHDQWTNAFGLGFEVVRKIQELLAPKVFYLSRISIKDFETRDDSSKRGFEREFGSLEPIIEITKVQVMGNMIIDKKRHSRVINVSARSEFHTYKTNRSGQMFYFANGKKLHDLKLDDIWQDTDLWKSK